MTELHADNLSKSLNALSVEFDRAKAVGDWEAAAKLWLQMLARADVVIRESRGARIEADSLAAELETYRPTRSGRPAAPPLEGFAYVHTVNFPWVCAAAERRELVYIPALFGGGYSQEHYTPERKTLCGKATTFPVTERFTSGGWPRLHELCPACTKILVDKGLISTARSHQLEAARESS